MVSLGGVLRRLATDDAARDAAGGGAPAPAGDDAELRRDCARGPARAGETDKLALPGPSKGTLALSVLFEGALALPLPSEGTLALSVLFEGTLALPLPSEGTLALSVLFEGTLALSVAVVRRLGWWRRRHVVRGRWRWAAAAVGLRRRRHFVRGRWQWASAAVV